MNLQLGAYLDRIGYDGALAPDLATLTALHRHHLLAIPYENLDVQLGRELTLDIDAIYEKIVRRRRGGWCYEGLMMLRGRSLKSVSRAGVSRTTIADAADYRQTLARIFKLDIPETDQLWSRILLREQQRTSQSA